MKATRTGHRFEEIQVWQKAKLLSLQIYKNFSDIKDYGFRDQVQRAAVSVMNNIAEGYERSSTNEFKRFILIAKGSAGEVRSMLILAKEMGYISNGTFEELTQLCIEISKMLAGLKRSLG